MAYIDELISRMERQEAVNSLHRHGVRNESVTCPNCGAEIEIVNDSDDDKEDWETQDGETTEDGGTTYNKSDMNKPQLTPEEKLARALVDAVNRRGANPQPPVNRPAQKPSAQPAQATTQPLAEENAALVLARAIAELRGERR